MKNFAYRLRRLLAWMTYAVKTKAPFAIQIAYLKMPFQSGDYPAWRQARADFQDFCATKNFTTDWFTPNVTAWLKAFSRPGVLDDRSRILLGLEIGSWEGMSSSFLLRQFPTMHLTCVDTWLGADEHVGTSAVTTVEQRFDANTHEFATRVTKWRGTSRSYFAAPSPAQKFDFIYVDGSHYVNDVLVDSVCAFEHLRVGGIIIFDDYQWQMYPDRTSNPAAALNAFFRLKSNEIEVLSVGHQIIGRRVHEVERSAMTFLEQ